MRPIPQQMGHDMTLLRLPEHHYRTDRLTGVLAVPISAETAAEYAVLPSLLTRSCAAYPTITALNQRLNQLYGATLQSTTMRVGGWQVLTFTVSYLNKKYTLDGSDLTGDCTDLLMELLFNPALENGTFPADVFAQEQRCLLERLQGEMNNKRTFARQRCEELLCPDHPFSLNPYGTEATINALTSDAAEAARQRLLSEATIHWLYQGEENTDALIQKLESRFATLPYRRPASLQVDNSFAMKESQLTERMALKQAKLVLGFRIAINEPNADVDAALLMNTLWGGCVTSLLFTHVREEQSLCYYCASLYDRFQSTILVDSGVEESDAQKAKDEILKQLEAIRQGNFSDEELEAARRALIQRYTSAGDNPDALEAYYLSQTIYDNYTTPDEKRSRILAVTKEDVCRAARLTHFDSTYLLAPEQEVTAE